MVLAMSCPRDGSGKFSHAQSFASIASKETITFEMISSFLRLPHATMPNVPLSRSDDQDIAAFIMDMKSSAPRGANGYSLHASMIATARVQPADARSILTGKHDTVKPVAGNCSRLCSFSMWQ